MLSATARSLVLLLFLAGISRAAEGELESRIVNGVFEFGEAATGALIFGSDPEQGFQFCSGTLIGCETFLTAAHCVCDLDGPACLGANAPDPSDYSIFLQHAGFFDVTSISLRSDYDFPTADVAVLKLGSPVSGVPPVPINMTASPAFGTPGTIVGFGTSGGDSDSGLKRSGAVTTAACSTEISNVTSVCWEFLSPLGPPGLDSNTCSGDSGGPLFVDLGSGTVVAGVTSGGTSASCLPTDQSFDANVYHYRSWIQMQAGNDLFSARCGDLGQVGTPDVQVQNLLGALGEGVTEETHSFTVPTGTTELRVTMNAHDDGSADFDLYVSRGSAPTTDDFDCRLFGFGQFGMCAFESPSPDEWFVLVNQFRGSGSYQVTATLFRSACSDPANAGDLCDDGDPCTTRDFCLLGTCFGTTVPDGTACEDGSLCTQGDTCAAGVCNPGSGPLSDCRLPTVPQKSRLLVIDRSRNSRDRLTWRWVRGEATSLEEFGDPTASTVHALCVYD
ncbi:MAG: trypsin-like serine protease, partial [Myxococcota bacterium]